MDGKFFEKRIFEIATCGDFNEVAVQLFQYQYDNNDVYRRYVDFLGVDRAGVGSVEQIPFMPVEFFKNFTVKTTCFDEALTFTSSGTTGANTSRHYVKDPDIYYRSLLEGFEQFYGSIRQYHVLALLPAYLERTGSSLVTMVEKFMEASGNGTDGFYLYDFEAMSRRIDHLMEASAKKILLIGVTFALLDFAEKHQQKYGNRVIIMETGGMKGRRKELVRDEVHQILCNGLGVSRIHSEYGMTELLSQAYSDGLGLYRETSTMRILIRDTTDPLRYVAPGVTGGINVVDLANIYSCAFVETKDLGIKYLDGTFKVLGRFDNSDTRGCNLLYVK
ncbi:MAG: acyltransferase [Bacteroidales bacterium]|nr:acyltransferase [Bacteroidales bacterium]